ncbi:MAG: 1-acyl-sn-glycerol-3-phosphate acyltransferase, partial [Oscillospiraceae bacterium]|nr:1-acyl-sn-glycerol-3-phosphate acyltransferase [Oscillospiraceae bacterium]
LNNPDSLDKTGYVACINHSSNWDPILIGACMRRPLRYMAKAELFKIPGLSFLVKLFGAYPVHREAADVASVKTTISILENGEVVGMYPQGTRAKGIHPENVTPKSGVAMVAFKAKTGILPVTVISKGYKVGAFKKNIVVFGKYISFGELEKIAEETKSENKMELYREVTQKIYGEILENYRKYDTLNK